MGYYTRYEFTTVEAPSAEAFRVAVAALSVVDVEDGDKHKWYDHDKDVTSAMKSTGATRVVLHGEGEEAGDVWDKEFTLVGGEVTIREYRYRLVRDAEPT